jgi:hypothetical protein
MQSEYINVDDMVPGKYYIVVPVDKTYVKYYIGKYLYGNTYPDNVYAFSPVIVLNNNSQFTYQDDLILDESEIEGVIESMLPFPRRKSVKKRATQRSRHGGKKSKKSKISKKFKKSY